MLADDLAAALRQTPGLSAGELVEALDGERGELEVTRALFSHHGRFRCDHGEPRRWWLVNAADARAATGGWRAVVAMPKRDVLTARFGIDNRGVTGGGRACPAPVAEPVGLRQPVEAPGGGPVRLYQWQRDALAAWARSRRRGVVEAVTGTGKTMMGIAAAAAELEAREQVLVLVPTMELQRQWVDQLTARLSSGARIGRLGGGAGDRLAGHDVLVAVVNSARGADVRPIRRGRLLVADECHRYGSAVNHLALDVRFSHRLGLSATYGRDDDGNCDWLDPYFGGTCFRMGYRRALAEGVVAHFTLALVGVELSTAEWKEYSRLTKDMGGLRARLVAAFGIPGEPLAAFLAAVNALADGSGGGATLARRYRAAMLSRRRLLAETASKDAALADLSGAIGAARRAFVFTQSIAASERAAAILGRSGVSAGVVHSELPSRQRRDVLRRFAVGDLRVISAPRVLDEGIDVPAADLAVIAGASHSRRKMVQRMGRVLRRKDGGGLAHLVVLYARDTVEDPVSGAHEAFLDEVVPLADEVRWLTAGTGCDDLAAFCRILGS